MPRLLPPIPYALAACAWLAMAPAAPAAQAARPAAGFAHAYAHGECAPWDGPAWRIVLQNAPVAPIPTSGRSRFGPLPTPAYPHYSVALWIGDPPLGRWIAIPDERQRGMGNGHISFVTAGPKYAAQKGRVRIDARTEAAITGELRLLVPDGTGRELVLPFHAKIVPYQAICG